MKDNMNYSKLLNTYSRYHVELAKGNGAYLYDTTGKEYVDFLCGIAVTSFGHNHPEITSAVTKQIENFWHVSNLFTSTPQENLAQKLSKKSGLDYVFFSNSGTESIEASIKLARKWGRGRNEIISTIGGFHGRTYGSLSATGQYKFWEGFEPFVPGFTHVPYNDLESVKHSINKNTVAVLIETIQGEGGVIVGSSDYLKGLRKLCTENNILLIIDEVQTGMGRTGKFFSYIHHGIVPDIVATAKGIANGLPLGAAICSKEVGDCIKPGNHGSTFGGSPVAIAAANKVVDLLDDNLLSKIEQLGNILMKSIKDLNLYSIKEIRGKGLLIGVEFVQGISCKEVAKKFLEEGVLVGTSGDSVLRILPPFIITEKEINKFVTALKKVVTAVSNKEI